MENETFLPDIIPQCDPNVATYMVMVWGTIKGYYNEWDYASNVYESYRRLFNPHAQHNVRLIRCENAVEPGTEIDWP